MKEGIFMSKKDRMLDHISNNVKWFLSTDTFEVIPYYNMSNSVFNRAKDYIVSGYIDFDDVVCLVSTSIFESGKSGILFTTDAMYCKSWGLLTTKYHNYYFDYDSANFDFHNDFYENRMKELMKALNDISVDKSNVGKKIGMAALGGAFLLDILSSIGDAAVSQNNDNIAEEIAKLENSNDQQTVDAITIYKEFIPLINQFANIYAKVDKEGDDISKETYYKIIDSLDDLLYELYEQTTENVDISPEDDEEYTRYANWLAFWALMFYDGDQFRESYHIKLLEEMPEWWSTIVELTDGILDNEEKDSLSYATNVFAETVINNNIKSLELMSSSDWDNDFFESMSEIVETNNQAVENLETVLDSITDCFTDLLSKID